MKTSRKLKGLTLVEIIVALAVFAVASSLLVVACVSVCNMNTDTTKLNKEVAYQAPAAENQNEAAAERAVTSAYAENIIIGYNGGNVAVQGDRYYVKDGSGVVDKDMDLQFFEVSEYIVTTTAVTTTAPTPTPPPAPGP